MLAVHHNSSSYASENAGHALMTDSMRQPITTSIPNEFTNRGLSVPCMQIPVDMSGQSRKNETSNVMLAQNPNVSMAQGLNGGMLKREAGYPGMPQFIYGGENNIMEPHPLSRDAPNLLYSRDDSNALPPLNETMMDAADSTSFGLLGNYGISDLTTEFSHGSGSPLSLSIYTCTQIYAQKHINADKYYSLCTFLVALISKKICHVSISTRLSNRLTMG